MEVCEGQRLRRESRLFRKPESQNINLYLSQLTHRVTKEEIARYTHDVVREGFFCGERKWGLRIRPSTLDVDFIVLTFIVLEKRRRDKATEDSRDLSRQEAICEGGTEMGCA